MSRKLTFDKIDETEEEELAVIKGELQDTGSNVVFMLDDEEDVVLVHMASANYDGDMSTILDEIVNQTGRQRIWFMNPLEQQMGDEDHTPLLDILDGFEVTTREMNGDEVTMYEGTWEVTDDDG